ncbi:MAG: type I asparaginase [Bacteroidota bacterium]
MTRRKKILIIYTGGTIGMVQRKRDGSYIPFDFKGIRSEFPELDQLDCELDIHSFDPPLDSSNIGPDIWVQIARTIADNYVEFDGFVVLHGSDTMAYTGSALSFMLEGLAKPVIFTGAQVPIQEIRTDAKENLVTAIQIASHPEQPIKEVAIYFGTKLFRANRTKKMHADVFSAFDSPNLPPLVEAGVHLYFRHQTPEDAFQGFRFKVQDKLESRIGHARFYPGLPFDNLDSILHHPGTRGIILQSFGAGNLPTNDAIAASIKKSIEMGKIILNITQCSGGSVEMGRYATSAMLLKNGVLSGVDLTFEAALTKMMYLMGKYEDPEEVRYYLVRNIRGEMRADRAYTT